MSKFCEHCGTQLDDDATFCSNCGMQINDNSNQLVKQPVTGNNLPLYIPSTPATIANNGSNLFKAVALVVLAVIFFLIPDKTMASIGKKLPSDSEMTKIAEETKDKIPANNPVKQDITTSNKSVQQNTPATKAVQNNNPNALTASQVTSIKNNSRQVLVNYINLLNNRRFQEAYNMFSNNWQSQISFNEYRSGYDNTVPHSQGVWVNRIDVMPNGRARVYFDLRSVDRKNGKNIESKFRGHWDVITENGRLVLDNPEVRKVQ